MPKEYEKYKAEWAVVLKEINQGLEDMHKDAQIVAQTTGVISEGAKEIGARVHVLKDGGMQGTDISAFMGDKDVKVMMQGQTDMLLTLEKELKRVGALH